MTSGPGLTAYLVVGAVLFAIGAAGVLSQRSAVMVLMSIEIVLNAAILNLVAFWRFVRPDAYDAQVFVLIAVTIGAVEMAAGLGLAVLVFRQRGTTNTDALAELKR
jgi:NADH-quinone oxidoreductase subunit K/NAD(P)H-quinone oxidoreductase subunit 4L